MARSDLKINYGDLRGIYGKLISTANALRRIESASKEFCEVMQKQEGASFDALNTYWEEFVNPGNTALLYQLDSIAALLKEYINAMESIIAPVDEYRISRVDREDIGFNLEQMKFNIDRLAENHMNCGVRDSWKDYWQYYVPNPFDEDWENEARRDRIDSENTAESGRRQRNYKKVIDIWDKIGGEYYSYFGGMYNGLKGIFDNSIIPYEVEDDNYAKKLDKLYDEWASNSDKAWDIADEVVKFLDGVFTAGNDLIEGMIFTIDTIPLYIAWGAECIYNKRCDEAGLSHVSFLSDKDREWIAPVNAGIEQMVTDPINAVEGMGQQAFDTADEEGWAYASGYAVGDVAAGIVLDKGMSELTKGSKVAGEVAEHADDVAYHSVGGDRATKNIQSVLDGIDIQYTSPESRFGQGFYVAADGDTTIAELAYHGTDAKYSIRYDMNLNGQRVLDLTDANIAKQWHFRQGESSLLECQNIAEKALDEGYNVIKVQSYRDSGINYVIYDNFDEILHPQMVTPVGE